MRIHDTITDLIGRAEKVGVSQGALADRAGVSKQNLSRLKSTGASCQMRIFEALAGAVAAAELERLRELAARYPAEAREAARAAESGGSGARASEAAA